jgi:hypothetical protein
MCALVTLLVSTAHTYNAQAQVDFGPQQIISTLANGASAVYAIDLDGDSDNDVLSASAISDKVTWYENDGNGNFGGQHIIDLLVDECVAIHAIDLDNDGDNDVLASGFFGAAWYENDGSGNFSKSYLSDIVANSNSIYADDLDNDGDNDICLNSLSDDRIF